MGKIRIQCYLLTILLLLCTTTVIYGEPAATYPTSLTMSSGFSKTLNQLRSQNSAFAIVINDKKQPTIENLSYVRNGSLMLPLREVSTAFGLDIRWNGSSRTVEVTDKNITAHAKYGSKEYSIGRMGPIKLNMYMEIKNGRSYVPVDFFSEVLNATLSIEDSTLQMDFKFSNLNSILKIHSIAETYQNTLQQKGYSDINAYVMYAGEEVGSVIYKANYKNFGSSQKELIPMVFNLKNGNALPLSMVINPKDIGNFNRHLSDKYNLSSLDVKNEGNFYLMKFYSQTFLILISKDGNKNYTDRWLPIESISDYLQIALR